MLRVPSDLPALLRSLSTGRESRLIRRGQAYSLSIHGANEVESILPDTEATPERLNQFLSAAVPLLKRTISKVSDDLRREFLAEAIACLGVEARRATIVMTWIACMDHLYEYVFAHKLDEFNAALARRSDKYAKMTVADRDDFSDIREAVFIEVCRSAGVISNDVRKILSEKLDTRNSCAHPATIRVSDSKVVSYIEDLVDNVIVKYDI